MKRWALLIVFGVILTGMIALDAVNTTQSPKTAPQSVETCKVDKPISPNTKTPQKANMSPTEAPTPKPTVRPKTDNKTGLMEGKTYEMRIYHYCSCKRCTPGTGITASGKRAKVGMVAMWGLPFGTVIEINGKRYTVEDRGVGARKVDIFCESHAETDRRGTYIAQVKIIKLGGNA